MFVYDNLSLKYFVQDYCRIDSDEEFQCDFYISIAVHYLTNAGVPQSKMEQPLYKMAVALLVAHWLENRQVTTTENNAPLKYSLQHIITQLKYCEDDAEGDN